MGRWRDAGSAGDARYPTSDLSSLYSRRWPVLRLHHQSYRLPDEGAWNAIERQVAAATWDMPMVGALMDGALHYVYADTLADLSIYSEFICPTGAVTPHLRRSPRQWRSECMKDANHRRPMPMLRVGRSTGRSHSRRVYRPTG